jgi:phosphoheptose isomerase
MMLSDMPMDAYSATTNFMTEMAEASLQVSGDSMEQATLLLVEAQREGRRVYIVGNGGSASSASHFACDLSKTARVAGEPTIRAFSLSDNIALLTAFANDIDYVRVFDEQVRSLVERGDIVIAITASGKSPNIVAAMVAAREVGAHTIALTGFDGGPVRDMADIAIHVPIRDYGLVESLHVGVIHAITRAIRGQVESRQLAAAGTASLLAR